MAQVAKDVRKNGNVINEACDDNLLDIVKFFKAGNKLKNALASLTRIRDSIMSIYLDDRIGMDMSLTERNPPVQLQSDYVPEALAVEATGEVGRLLLDGSVRARVQV